MSNFYVLTPLPLNCMPRVLARGVISLTLLIILFVRCFKCVISLCCHQYLGWAGWAGIGRGYTLDYYIWMIGGIGIGWEYDRWNGNR